MICGSTSHLRGSFTTKMLGVLGLASRVLPDPNLGVHVDRADVTRACVSVCRDGLSLVVKTCIKFDRPDAAELQDVSEP